MRNSLAKEIARELRATSGKKNEKPMTNQPQNTAPPDSLPEELVIQMFREANGSILNCVPDMPERTRIALANAISETMHEFLIAPIIHQQDEKIKTLEMQGKWLPIDTAPKDEGDIMLWDEYPLFASWKCLRNYRNVVQYEGWVGDDGRKVTAATHWQPLPYPPKPDAQPEGSEG